MAVLTLPGADALLAVQAAALPQPDQLCGPFAAHVALHAVQRPTEVPAMISLAHAAGTAIWPHDVAAGRPAGAPLDRTGWDLLPVAPDPATSGTDAEGLAEGIAVATRGVVAVVPVSGVGSRAGSLGELLVGVATSGVSIGVVANVATGALDPDTDWDVGHFVVVWAVDVAGPDGDRVALADTYREVGAPGEPAGCRWVSLARLADAIGAGPGRGLLLVVRAAAVGTVTELVAGAHLELTPWST